MTALLSSFRAVTCAGLATLGFFGVAQAQEPAVFHACVTPLTGLIYQPREPGKCFHSTHRAISWTDGLGAFPAASALGGDLAGTLPDPSVSGLQGRPVSAAAPAANDVLTWDGTAWSPASPGEVVIGPDAVGSSEIVDGSVTAADLAGSYDPGGTEAVPGAVTSEKIADGTIQARDVAPGTFVNVTSPNGQFSLSVTDAGLVLDGPGGFVKITAAGIEVLSHATLALHTFTALDIRGGTSIDMRSGSNMNVRSGTSLVLQGGSTADLSGGGVVTVSGSVVGLNGTTGGCPAAKVGSVVTGTAAATGAVTGSVVTGSPTVLVPC